MTFSKRAEELRIGKIAEEPNIECIASRGALVTRRQCDSRNHSYQQNVRVCVSCPRRACPKCLSEGRREPNLVVDGTVCLDHQQQGSETRPVLTSPRVNIFTPSEESYQKEQSRKVVRPGCGALNDHSLIDYHSLIER